MDQKQFIRCRAVIGHCSIDDYYGGRWIFVDAELKQTKQIGKYTYGELSAMVSGVKIPPIECFYHNLYIAENNTLYYKLSKYVQHLVCEYSRKTNRGLLHPESIDYLTDIVIGVFNNTGRSVSIDHSDVSTISLDNGYSSYYAYNLDKIKNDIDRKWDQVLQEMYDEDAIAADRIYSSMYNCCNIDYLRAYMIARPSYIVIG